MKFWAVFGSQGCREKKNLNCHKDATFWGGFFYFFVGKKLKIILAATQKSINAKKILQNFGKYIFVCENRQQTYSEISL